MYDIRSPLIWSHHFIAYLLISNIKYVINSTSFFRLINYNYLKIIMRIYCILTLIIWRHKNTHTQKYIERGKNENSMGKLCVHIRYRGKELMSLLTSSSSSHFVHSELRSLLSAPLSSFLPQVSSFRHYASSFSNEHAMHFDFLCCDFV